MIDKSKISKDLPLAKRTGKIASASMNLSDPAARKRVANTAKRVIKTHSKVIKALAKR
ncbi:MAG: hypothetical protein WAN92_02055 [Herbaspirillum sp.]